MTAENSTTPVRGSAGHVLNALKALRIPSTILDNLTIDRETIVYRGFQDWARFKYFDGIEDPVFRFQGNNFPHRFICQEDGSLKPDFRLSLSFNETLCFDIGGKDASKDLYFFLKTDFLTPWSNKPGYHVSRGAGAFFQGGSAAPEGEWFMIEFWKPPGAQAAMDWINENYRPGTYDPELVDYCCRPR